jgi:uncharacterized protein YndB with AHSA1/START domain
MSDRIERTIDLKAPIERVWRALSDPAEFGAWFGLKLSGAFVPGAIARGSITNPGYEHLIWEVRIAAMDAPRLFSFHWHPYAVDPAIDYSHEPPTLVEFRLEPLGDGTRLTVTETGFENVPAHRRDEAMRMNGQGWTIQMENIRAHVDA